MTARLARQLFLVGTAVAVPVGTATAQTNTTPTVTTGTTAGTTITNTATATYTVNGTQNSVDSNVASFKVDRKVNLTVEAPTASTKVTSGQQDAAVRFKVTNKTNAVQDFLVIGHQPSDLLGISLNDEDWDLANPKVVVDNGDGIYDSNDTATYIDELNPDESRYVFIVGNVSTAANLHKAYVGLEVQVAAGETPNAQGPALVESAVNLDNRVDVVFADDDNDSGGPDLLHNGRSWVYGVFEMGATTLDIRVNKVATVVSDGLGSLNPKAVPGATVQYCLTISNNTLLSTATNLKLTDVIPTGSTYVRGSINAGALGLNGACLLNGVPIADNGSTTGSLGGSFDENSKTVTATIASLTGGNSIAASFQVTIN